jgi:hypothetical protein
LRFSQCCWAKRSSTAKSRPFDQADRVFWAVELRASRVVRLLCRHDAIAQYLPVTFLVITEQAGSEVVTASVSLAEADIDLQFHRHIPLC